MTDLDLQEVIIRELKDMCKEQSLMKMEGEVWKDYNIYRQDKPYKDDDDDGAQEDYIIVLIDDEDTDDDGNWIVSIQILFSIILYDEEHQGNLILANLMNQVYSRFKRMGILGGKYVMENEAHKRFNHECPPVYYESALITKWKLPEEHQEGLDQLL